MEITVFGANGRAGRNIVRIALENGLKVRAAMRNVQRKDNFVDRRATLVELDINNPESIQKAIGNSSVMINTIKFNYDTVEPDDKTKLFQQLMAAAKDTSIKRILQMGGAGALRTIDGRFLYQSKDFPEKPFKLGRSHANLRKYLESKPQAIDWTYLIPPPMFLPNGPQTRQYAMMDAEYPFYGENELQISYADFAWAVVEEVLHSKQLNKCVLITN